MKRFIFLLLLLAGMGVIFGCAQVRDDDSTKPWPPPEPYERQFEISPFIRE